MSEVSIVYILYIVSNRHFRHVHPVYYKLIAILSRQYHIILWLVGRKYILYWQSREATKPIRRIYFLPTPQYNVVLTAQNRN